MREIKFRGKCLKSGIFVYGGYAEDVITAESIVAKVGIIPAGCYSIAVDPETVGQFTGLHDKNGKEVFDGDILNIVRLNGSSAATGEVEYKDGAWIVDEGVFIGFQIIGRCSPDILEVIGNVHETPDLMENKNEH